MGHTETDRLAALFRPTPTQVAAATERVLGPGASPVDPGPILPEQGMSAEHALSLVVAHLRPDPSGVATPGPTAATGATASDLGHPGFFAHMDPPTPWVTWVATMAAASANQNLLHPDTGAAARHLEERVVSWLAPVFGMDGGHLVPGSSVANLTALWAARDTAAVTTVVTSSQAHLSVRKAARILGLTLVAVDPTGPGGALTHDDITNAVGDAGVGPEHIALTLTAGTTGLGAIDALPSGPGGEHGLGWIHVDAAWAGPLRLSERYRNRLDGIDQADSVAISAHKWLFQPKESAMILFRRTEQANPAISVDAAYLQVPNVGIQGSHGAAAAPLAATLLTLGRAGMAELIDHCMDLADELARRVDEHPDLVRHDDGSSGRTGRTASGVVVWRPVSADIEADIEADIDAAVATAVDLGAIRDRMVGAFVSTVRIGGETWLRSVAANPMADPALVVDAVVTAANELRPS